MTNRQGAQGTLDSASKQELENEFGTSKDEDVIEKILAKGDKIHSKVSTYTARTVIKWDNQPELRY